MGLGLAIRTHGTRGPSNLIVTLRGDLVCTGPSSHWGFYALTPIRDAACFSSGDRDAGPLRQCQSDFPCPELAQAPRASTLYTQTCPVTKPILSSAERTVTPPTRG